MEKKQKFPILPWWTEAREFFSEPVLLEFIESLDKKFHSIDFTFPKFEEQPIIVLRKIIVSE